MATVAAAAPPSAEPPHAARAAGTRARRPPTCPRCHGPIASALGEGPVFCADCGGAFVPHAAMRAVLEEARHVVDASTPAEDVVQYLPCPVCGERMRRRLFAHRSAVVVDECGAHGVWFDAGEISRAVPHVDSALDSEGRLVEVRRSFALWLT